MPQRAKIRPNAYDTLRRKIASLMLGDNRAGASALAETQEMTMTTIECSTWRTDAYQAGWSAFESDVSRDDNPFATVPGAHARWYDWLAGWDDRAFLADRERQAAA